MHSVFIISHTAEQLQRSGELKYADTSFLNGYVFASVNLSLSIQQLTTKAVPIKADDRI